MCVRECVCVCARARSACVFVNSLVYSQCYHISADACQKKSSGASTTSVLLPQSTCHTNTAHTHTYTHTPHTPHTTAIIKSREGEPEEKKMTDSDRRGGGAERQVENEREVVREGWQRMERAVY